jgi:glucosamine--fructose-6-phosphate aminotransferase (isomerizing)
MCGIVGYIGPRNAVPILLDGLRRLEYRGYDSAGLATLDNGRLEIRRCVGRLDGLSRVLEDQPAAGRPGIGHTRWATHGEPSERNSHPHASGSGRIAVVHNGIIENYQELKERLQAKGHVFLSETDTEVIPHLIEEELNAGAADFPDAVRRALRQARGAYALGILSLDQPDTLYAARLGSPLIVGCGRQETMIASDVPAILNHVSQVVYLNDGEVAVLQPGRVEITRLDGTPVKPDIQKISLQAEAAERAGFETFMLKEIHEQPRVIRNLIHRHLADPEAGPRVTGIDLKDDIIRAIRRVMIISCGTAYYAGLYGRLLLEHYTGLVAEIELGSEFRYRDVKLDDRTLVIAVSQSGETADTLASVRRAREQGCAIFSICNVPGSSLVRDSQGVFFTEAGPEIGVASTKAYTAQLTAFALLAIHFGQVRGEMTAAQAAERVKDLRHLPDLLHYVLDRKERIQRVADKHHDGPSALYLGRKFNYPTALEGALKNKEISYQHAEGYAAGEMKHGPIALISEYMPVICICTRTADEVYEKMISNMREVEARHGRIIAVVSDGDTRAGGIAEDVLYVPETRDEFSPIVNVVALQLLAYYAAQARGTDIDRPRNLAKSVTVE